MRKLAKLAPGKSGAVTTLQLPDGTLTSSPPEVAEGIRAFWQPVFSLKHVHDHDIDAFLEKELSATNGLREQVGQIADANWRVTRRDIERALDLASRSAVGPDGIPYSAWKALKKLGVDILHEVIRDMEHSDGQARLLDNFPEEAGVSSFNEALLICIPKKVAHTAPDGTTFYLPQQLRPLSIVNCDNRLLASAARLRYEQSLSKLIGGAQRGFLKGRSMLKNVMLVDTRMRTACAASGAAGAVFFDFEAAFPSLSHRYLHRLLARLGLPAAVQNLVRALYLGHGCKVAQQGSLSEAFAVEAGIRQGCPLSPLLFALAIEPLLRRLQAVDPELLVCAYADDIGAVSEDLFGLLIAAAPIFGAFGRASGLHLNLSKTVIVPLGEASPDAVRQWLSTRLGWHTVPVQLWAEYLGFCLGPEASDRSWAKVFDKMETRAGLWAAVGVGMHWTALACNTFIHSLAGFLLQFLPLPVEWSATEASLCRRLFPGPGGWLRAADLHHLDQAGMPTAVRNLRDTSLAARFRVAHREALDEGGLHHRRLLRQILDADRLADQSAVIRLARWRKWMMTSFAAHLEDACQELGSRGVTIRTVEDKLIGGMPRPLTAARERQVHSGLQRAVQRQLLGQRDLPWFRRFRARLEIFSMPLLPGHRPQRALNTLQALRPLVPPRVIAAVLRTWLHGWCTERRFQTRGSKCMWGCVYGEDDLRHYVCCRRLRLTAERALGLPPLPSHAHPAEDFLLLRPGADDAKTQLATRAVRVAAAYQLHCRRRHDKRGWARLSPEGQMHALRQASMAMRGSAARSADCSTSAWGSASS